MLKKKDKTHHQESDVTLNNTLKDWYGKSDGNFLTSVFQRSKYYMAKNDFNDCR